MKRPNDRKDFLKKMAADTGCISMAGALTAFRVAPIHLIPMRNKYRLIQRNRIANL